MINLKTLNNYILRGERGPTLINFLFFLLFNCIFIYLVTILWNTFLGKDLGVYRLYFSSAFSSWVALTSVIHFGGWNFESYRENLKYILLASMSIFVCQYLISIYILCFPLGLISFVNSLEIILLQTVSFILLSPIVITLSIIRSLNALCRSIIRVMWRLLFFLTPIIWMPSFLLLEIRGNWVTFNPFTLISIPPLHILNEQILLFPNDSYVTIILSIGCTLFLIFLLFIVGNDTLGNYFSNMVSSNQRKEKYEGNIYPSFFIHSANKGTSIKKRIGKDEKLKFVFRTDVQNNYFSRISDKGHLEVKYYIRNVGKILSDTKIVYLNGKINFSCLLPNKLLNEKELKLEFFLIDRKNKLKVEALVIPEKI